MCRAARAAYHDIFNYLFFKWKLRLWWFIIIRYDNIVGWAGAACGKEESFVINRTAYNIYIGYI